LRAIWANFYVPLLIALSCVRIPGDKYEHLEHCFL
jgi:hypothetical protein